ncbi:Putative formamidase C869.04 [Linum perenne]
MAQRHQYGARLVFPIDLKKKPWEQDLPLHNRWHPDIPPVADVVAGEVFRVEMMDFSGGRITKEFTAEDIKFADPTVVTTPRVVISVDVKKKPWMQNPPLHNRWHPDIPPVEQVTAGEFFRVEMVDWTGGVVQDDGSALDIKTIDLSSVRFVDFVLVPVQTFGTILKRLDLFAGASSEWTDQSGGRRWSSGEARGFACSGDM